MEQLIIYKRNGDKLNLYNRVDSAEQVKNFLGQDQVNIAVRSPEPLRFDIGDRITVFGEHYTINLLPKERKNNDREFEYNVTFEGVQYDLIKVQMLDIDDSGFSTGANFSLMADIEDYVKLVVRNLNRVYGAGKWLIGDVKQNTEHLLIDFTNNNCLEALQNLCDQYSTHFQIEVVGNSYRLNVKNIDTVLPDTFEYGRHRGLYNLGRTNVSAKNIVTRLYAFGGTTNIPGDYRGGAIRLKMPINVIYSEGQPYITDAGAVADYGVAEGAINFDEVYPRRTGTITQIDQDRLVFFDNTMPFDINQQLLPGLNPKINFKSGALAGYTFDAPVYDHTQKKFIINPYTDDRGFVFPSVDNNAFRMAVGDEYVIIDIKMPQSYITQAENELYTKAVDQLSIQSVPALQWELEIDGNFLKSKEIVPGQIINYFQTGYLLNVVDQDLKINGRSQVIGFTRSMLRPYEYKLTVSEQFVNKRQIQRTFRGIDIRLLEGLNMGRVTRAISNNFQTQINQVVNNIQTTIQSQISQATNWGNREW